MGQCRYLQQLIEPAFSRGRIRHLLPRPLDLDRLDTFHFPMPAGLFGADTFAQGFVRFDSKRTFVGT